MFNKIFTDDWIRTADLCYRKGVLYNWATTTAHGLERHFKHFRLILGFIWLLEWKVNRKVKLLVATQLTKFDPILDF